jgi:hypothetical protein
MYLFAITGGDKSTSSKNRVFEWCFSKIVDTIEVAGEQPIIGLIRLRFHARFCLEKPPVVVVRPEAVRLLSTFLAGDRNREQS